MPNPFISPQDVVDYLGRGGTADPGLLIATDAACDMVRDVAEQTFNRVYSDTVTLDGTGSDALLLPQRPVSAAGTVTINGGTVTDYVLRADGALIRKANTATLADWGDWWSWPNSLSTVWPDSPTYATPLVWPYGRQNIAVTYDHGYIDAEIPRSVRMVALSLAARLVVQGPAAQETIGNVSVRYGVNSTDLTAGELRILRKYRQAA